MKNKVRLSKSMTLSQFENGYWYATELKDFAETIGVRSASRLRKDELESALISFFKTGRVVAPTKRNLEKPGLKDVENGLTLDLRVINYTSNRETKRFLEEEAHKLAPNLKRKSGARYRLNRWREEQLTSGIKITYGDLVRQYIALNQTEQPFDKIPSGRYINFLSDFLKNEKGASRVQAIKAWHQLKRLDIPKNYLSWVKFRSGS